MKEGRKEWRKGGGKKKKQKEKTLQKRKKANMYYVDSIAEYRWRFCFSMYSHLKILVASE